MLGGILHDAGYYMGENLYPGNIANPKGFFENEVINGINEKILKQFCPDSRFSNIQMQRWLMALDAEAQVTCTDENVLEKIAQQVHPTPFCYKDPRFSYTYPVWQPFLPENTKILVVFRSPQETMKSIIQECINAEYLSDLYIDEEHAYKVWESVYSHILTYAETNRFLFVHFQQLLSGEVLPGLSQFLGVEVAGDFVDKSLSRTKVNKEIVPQSCVDLYNKLCGLAGYGKPLQNEEVNSSETLEIYTDRIASKEALIHRKAELLRKKNEQYEVGFIENKKKLEEQQKQIEVLQNKLRLSSEKLKKKEEQQKAAKPDLQPALYEAKKQYRDIVLFLHAWAGKRNGMKTLGKRLKFWLPEIPPEPAQFFSELVENTKPYKISVITPSFNSGSDIERAIRSVMKQDYDNWEHIIIDGGSTDNTLDILKKYDHLIWVSEPDNGQIDAMNKGFNCSTGDIIVYLNADDYFADDVFSSVLKVFSPDTMMVFGKVQVYSEATDKWWVNNPKTDFKSVLRHWETDAFCVNPVGYFYRREVQEKVPLKEENGAKHDLAFLMEAAFHYEKQTKKLDKVFGTFMHMTDTQTVKEQSQPDYWSKETFFFIEPLLKQLSDREKSQFRVGQEAGYEERKRWIGKEAKYKKRIGHALAPRYFINEDVKLGYLSIPKNACTSIKYALLVVSNNEMKSLKKNAIHLHTDAENLFDEVRSVNHGKPEKIFTFSFVRHPVDRFLSFYRNKILLNWDENLDSWMRASGFYPEMDVSKCISVLSGLDREYLNEHVALQTDFLLREGQLLVDFVGKIENLEQDLKRLQDTSGVFLSIPIMNKTKGRCDLPNLSQNDFLKLYAIYKEDFKNFSYSMPESGDPDIKG